MTQDMKILEKLGHNTVEIQQLINYYILGIFIYLWAYFRFIYKFLKYKQLSKSLKTNLKLKFFSPNIMRTHAEVSPGESD